MVRWDDVGGYPRWRPVGPCPRGPLVGLEGVLVGQGSPLVAPVALGVRADLVLDGDDRVLAGAHGRAIACPQEVVCELALLVGRRLPRVPDVACGLARRPTGRVCRLGLPSPPRAGTFLLREGRGLATQTPA